MKKVISFIFIVFSLASFSIVKNYREIKYPPLKSPHRVKPVILKLKNGLTVLLLEDHELPVISGEIMFHGGSVCDPEGKEGLSEIFSEVLRSGGNSIMSGDEMDNFLEETASSIECSSDETSVTVEFKCLKENFQKVFDLFFETIHSPRFDSKKIQVAKSRMSAIIVRRNDDPRSIARRVFLRRVYGLKSPFSKQAELNTISSISRNDLLLFWKKHLVASNAVMYIYGDFNIENMKKLVKERFGKLTRGKRVNLNLNISPEKPGIYFVERKGVTQSNIVFGNPVNLEKRDSDYPAAVLFSKIVGGGFSSRFMRTIRRDMGLSYSPYAFISVPFEHSGYFMAVINTRLNATGRVIDVAKKIIADIQKSGVTDDELNQVKEEFLNSYVFQFDSKEKQVAKAAIYLFYGYPMDFNERFFNAVKRVKKSDIQRIAKKYIHLDKLVFSVVGDSSKFDRPLNVFGPVHPVDVSIPGLKEMQKRRAMIMKIKTMKQKAKRVTDKKRKRKKESKTEKTEKKKSGLNRFILMAPFDGAFFVDFIV